MFYYLTYYSRNGNSVHVWTVVEQKQKGWCKLAFTYVIENGVLGDRPSHIPYREYAGRITNVPDDYGGRIKTAKIYGIHGGDHWVRLDVANTLEELLN